MSSIATVEPTEFRAGDTVQWTRALQDYLPADGWSLEYTFAARRDALVVSTTDNGDGSFLATITSAKTIELPAGRYEWVGVVTKGAERFTPVHGFTTALPNIAAFSEGGRDGRVHAERALELIEQAIEGRFPAGMESFTIAGRAVALMKPLELMQWRNRYRSEVAEIRDRERMRTGKGSGSSRRHKVRF